IPCFKLGKLLFARAVYQKLFVIYITNIHRFHALPLVGHFCFKMSCLDRFCITLDRIFFDAKPVVTIGEHTLYVVGMEICPFAQYDGDGWDVVNPLSKCCISFSFEKNKRTVHTYLFLKTRMAVIPIGTILLYGKTI